MVAHPVVLVYNGPSIYQKLFNKKAMFKNQNIKMFVIDKSPKARGSNKIKLK